MAVSKWIQNSLKSPIPQNTHYRYFDPNMLKQSNPQLHIHLIHVFLNFILVNTIKVQFKFCLESQIQYQLHQHKENTQMGSCYCVNRQANKRIKKDLKFKPLRFQQSREFKLELQNMTSTISQSARKSAPPNLFKTFEDWDTRISYQKARSAQSKWQNDRIVMQKYGELRGLECEQKQRKDSGTTVESYRKIETKNKIIV